MDLKFNPRIFASDLIPLFCEKKVDNTVLNRWKKFKSGFKYKMLKKLVDIYLNYFKNPSNI